MTRKTQSYKYKIFNTIQKLLNKMFKESKKSNWFRNHQVEKNLTNMIGS